MCAYVRVYFRYTRFFSGAFVHLQFTVSLVKNFFRLSKNSETFYRYSSCLVRNLAMGRALFRESVCATKCYCSELVYSGVFFLVSEYISEIIAGYVLDCYILIREDVRFLCLSQSPRLYGTSISLKDLAEIQPVWIC